MKMDINDNGTGWPDEPLNLAQMMVVLDTNDKPDKEKETLSYYFTTKLYNVTRIVKYAKRNSKIIINSY